MFHSLLLTLVIDFDLNQLLLEDISVIIQTLGHLFNKPLIYRQPYLRNRRIILAFWLVYGGNIRFNRSLECLTKTAF